MQTLRQSSDHLIGLKPYDPRYLPARIYLNANESPYGLPEPVVKELTESLTKECLNRYPDPLAKHLRARLADVYGISENAVLLGNGGDELLFDVLLAYGGKKRKLLIAPPSFSSYEIDARLTNTQLVEVRRQKRGALVPHAKNATAEDGATFNYTLDEDAVLKRVAQGDIDIVMLASPNNPTGDVLDPAFINELLNASDALILIDQAYIEFAQEAYDALPLLRQHKNLAILRTFSKAYGLAGMRLGYLLAAEELVSELLKVRQPYSVDAFSALAGWAVLNNREAFSGRMRESIEERRRVSKALSKLPGLKVFDSEANFILIQLENAHKIWQALYDEKALLLRDFSEAPYLGDCLRISIGSPEENDELLASLQTMMKEVT
jgi:histidinol-phosphate aminotransferase